MAVYGTYTARSKLGYAFEQHLGSFTILPNDLIIPRDSEVKSGLFFLELKDASGTDLNSIAGFVFSSLSESRLIGVKVRESIPTEQGLIYEPLLMACTRLSVRQSVSQSIISVAVGLVCLVTYSCILSCLVTYYRKNLPAVSLEISSTCDVDDIPRSNVAALYSRCG